MEARFVKSQAKFEKLKEMAKKLRRLPVAELETPGGHGGSAKCREIEFGEERVERGTRSKQLSVYNESVVMGHFFIEDRRHVVTDTPGLIFRADRRAKQD